MRVLLFTGSGGSGVTTIAAATARRAAAHGTKTLLIGVDTHHRLADILDVPAGAGPQPVAAGLWAMQADPQRRIEDSWRDNKDIVSALVDRLELSALAKDELVAAPAAYELAVLMDLHAQLASAEWDLVVVDCGGAESAGRLLMLTANLQWYLDRLLPEQMRMLSRLGAMLPGLDDAGSTVAAARTLGRLLGRLDELQEVLLDRPRTSVRLVSTADGQPLRAIKRLYRALRLHGFGVDAVVLNQLVPGDGDDPWRTSRARAQRQYVEQARTAFTEPQVHEVPFDAHLDDPAALATTVDVGAGLAEAATEPAYTVHKSSDAPEYQLDISAPFTDRDSIALARINDHLIITIDGLRCFYRLPSGLQRCVVRRAEYVDDTLRVTFAPDPEVWPS